MAMGGGGSAGVPQAGLTPLQQQQMQQGQQLIDQNTPMANVMMQRNLMGQQAVNNFLTSRNKFTDFQQKFVGQQANWARGGMMAQGLNQMRQGLNGPDLAPGIQSRMGARMGIGMDPNTAAQVASQQALSSTSNKIGLANQARYGLAQAQRDMRFGGM